ncbi:hypothetical protein [Bacillus sp. FSL P2-0235]|uniref:hypothetical protein n=1 Tax=Bacillus sp. FSL P2-0235 TaxID=2978211 RepID=UPI0030FBEF74
MFFRRGKDGTSQAFTGEAFIKIKKSELLKELIQYFEGISSMNIVEVVSFLSEKTNYETEALYNYLFKLEKMGVLDFSLGVSEQSDNYTKDLIENLLGIKDSLVEKSVSHLVEIEKIQAIFSESNYQKRYVLLKNLQEHIKKIYSLFDLKLESNDLTSLLFEDVSYKNTKIILNENQWKTHLDDFNLIKNLMPLFDDNILEKLSMNIIFKDIYGNKGAIDLLEFYREFNKYDKNLLWKKIRKNDTYLYLKKLRTEFYDYLETQINMGLDTIFLNKSWLKKFINKFPDLLKSKENYSFYFQIAYDNQDNRILVLNKIGPGLGKHFSRYGNLFLNSEYKENNRFINSLIEQYKKYDQNGGFNRFKCSVRSKS